MRSTDDETLARHHEMGAVSHRVIARIAARTRTPSMDLVRAEIMAALPHLEPNEGRAHRQNITGAGSAAVGGADGDMVLGQTLVEVKAVRTADLRKRDLQQLVSYALLDWDDQYSFDEVGILSARHAVLVRWPLEQLIADASRGSTLAAIREEVYAALRGDD